MMDLGVYESLRVDIGGGEVSNGTDGNQNPIASSRFVFLFQNMQAIKPLVT
jgi:hypothetical protein